MFRVKPIFGILVVGAIVLLFTSYIALASVGHAQMVSPKNVTHSLAISSTRATQPPTATIAIVPTVTSPAVATDTPIVPTATSPVIVTATPTVSTVTDTLPAKSTPIATPVDTANSSIDQLPVNTSYYCNRVQYLGEKWPVHLYVGGCLVSEINQYSWSIDTIKSVLDTTVCATSEICTISVNTVAYFLHNEIHHITTESNQCGGRGIYVHVFGGFFRTHPVC